MRDSDFDDSRFYAVPAELISSDAANDVVAAVIERSGRVNVLVHLVGGFVGGSAVADTDDSVLEEMLEVNLKSSFFIAKAALQRIWKQQSGHAFMVGSRAAVSKTPMPEPIAHRKPRWLR